MRASVKRDTTMRVITLEVSGVPDVDTTKSWQTKPRVFQPDLVTITVVDGQVSRLEASGQLRIKSGETTPKVREEMGWIEDATWGLDQNLSAAPEWVRTLWNEAPAGVTSWGQPTEVPT